MAINTDQPNDENFDELVMISDDDEAKISKSLIKTDIEIKNKINLKTEKNKNRKPVACLRGCGHNSLRILSALF